MQTLETKLPLTNHPAPTRTLHPAILTEVEMIISAMEAGGQCRFNRRSQQRLPWRVQATVRLFVDTPGHPQRVIYTRDIHSRSLGFVTPDRLPLGYGGMVDLPSSDGSIISVACTVLRCRLATPGWHEGVVYFNREQMGVEHWIG